MATADHVLISGETTSGTLVGYSLVGFALLAIAVLQKWKIWVLIQFPLNTYCVSVRFCRSSFTLEYWPD